jgi:hypothetical protein
MTPTVTDDLPTDGFLEDAAHFPGGHAAAVHAAWALRGVTMSVVKTPHG